MAPSGTAGGKHFKHVTPAWELDSSTMGPGALCFQGCLAPVVGASRGLEGPDMLFVHKSTCNPTPASDTPS